MVLRMKGAGLSVMGGPGDQSEAGFPGPRAERVRFLSRQKEEGFGVGGGSKWC